MFQWGRNPQIYCLRRSQSNHLPAQSVRTAVPSKPTCQPWEALPKRMWGSIRPQNSNANAVTMQLGAECIRNGSRARSTNDHPLKDAIPLVEYAKQTSFHNAMTLQGVFSTPNYRFCLLSVLSSHPFLIRCYQVTKQPVQGLKERSVQVPRGHCAVEKSLGQPLQKARLLQDCQLPLLADVSR